ncbi:MAG: hypothetical protein H6822_03300 [Planctomycetaceae bacterium]|nr:hypothetical protein [Planctomycetales bacterium]MCB9921180.1 hypothetical protein [Planctomycetaceae bacterium]
MNSLPNDHDFVAKAYASPQFTDRDPPRDFRDEAAAISLKLVADSFGRPSAELGQSLCLPVENPSDLRGVKWSLLFRLVFGIGGIAAGGILAMVFEKFPAGFQRYETPALVLAGIFSIGGICLLISSAGAARSFSRRRLGERYEAVWALGSPIKPLGVSVEDADTFSKMKLVPEDLAWIGFDLSRRMLLIEGLRYRYLIHSADVINIEQVAGPTATGVAITYFVGSASLRIALQYDSVKHELRRQTIGAKHDPLLKPITDTLVEPATLV